MVPDLLCSAPRWDPSPGAISSLYSASGFLTGSGASKHTFQQLGRVVRLSPRPVPDLVAAGEARSVAELEGFAKPAPLAPLEFGFDVGFSVGRGEAEILVDRDRIYVGGCSNGAYLIFKLIIEYPDFFAAAFPSALAYRAAYFTDAQVDRIKDIPIWFIQSKNDGTTEPEQTVVPIYKRLMEEGARDVHFSYYDHVVNITAFFGGDGYHYPGHWSWIYSHADEA